jgi:cytochrome b6-f complex iron-sulfur subunit
MEEKPMEGKPVEEKTDSSRRRFLTLGVGAAGTAIALGYIGTAAKFLEPPAANAEALKEVGKVSEFEVGVPKLVTYQGNSEEGVYVTNMGSDGWMALDFHCTHLQCAVNYVDAVKKFMCPCHGGTYDIKGHVLSGPPPRNLHQRVIKVQGDSVMVGGMLS